MKWWDLDTQHCFKTLVGHRTEVKKMNVQRAIEMEGLWIGFGLGFGLAHLVLFVFSGVVN